MIALPGTEVVVVRHVSIATYDYSHTCGFSTHLCIEITKKKQFRNFAFFAVNSSNSVNKFTDSVIQGFICR